MSAAKPLRISLATGRGGAPKATYLVLEWEGMIAVIRAQEEGDGFMVGGGELYATIASMVKGQSDLDPDAFTYAEGVYSVIIAGAMRTFSMPTLLRESEVVAIEPDAPEGSEPTPQPKAEDPVVSVPAPSAAIAEASTPPVPVEEHPTSTATS